ncbi:hypothetical protein PFICI_06649 [Pestalotiopsis fici W106-1]|uniref:Nephrocystin 3-like N-terminal domain-containing protein n=1 Tax=Pestalotiopsis fici (strain W106-1 / CGMCC3.15140) TaxID=1229662 RepID=W3X8A9_PESFW|nr:uncharacterized protein PFICI_06649 [Pestalotiopsis fici W106-1]ETS81647.1 hypothetical protein PFICI_06649 [Pestalotiopsis fici W106-1]
MQTIEIPHSIIFVHGLQGHPYTTWTHFAPEVSANEARQKTKTRSHRKILTFIGRTTSSSVKSSTNEEAEIVPSSNTIRPNVFWPRDLLPSSEMCSGSRILTWGYESTVAAHIGTVANKGTIFSHAKDLLFALRRNRVQDRPLIFVAHSLGGILVKEALSLSDTSDQDDIREIVASTSAVIFLGTPHRGGGHYANVGEVARSVASLFLIDTNSALLDSLGLRTTDLERCQFSFSRIWRRYGFMVKTFQEGHAMTGLNVPGSFLNKTVVPHNSSLLGDDREDAETLQANHREMTKFTSEADDNYIKVCGELERICKIVKERAQETIQRSLGFPNMNRRYQMIETPVHQTCLWLSTSENYQGWIERKQIASHQGFLWIKGKPGSGKSTLMKHAFEGVHTTTKTVKASFFFNGRGDRLEKCTSGFLRSLACQLLPHFPKAFRLMKSRFEEKIDFDTELTWHDGELKSFLNHALASSDSRLSSARIFIFVDGLDECDNGEGRNLIIYLRDLADRAYLVGTQLFLCVSSRTALTISISSYLEILSEQENSDDIRRYIHKRLSVFRTEQKATSQREVWQQLENKILDKASGIFLWVELTINQLISDWDTGKSAQYLIDQVNEVPTQIQDVYRKLLSENPTQEATRFFQWLVFSARPLQLSEWKHVFAFVYHPEKVAMWENSPEFVEDEEQLEKQITSMSCGLVEVQDNRPALNENDELGEDDDSLGGSAGSFTTGKVVQFIHDSVRTFFLEEDGFTIVSPQRRAMDSGRGHVFIMDCCLSYADIPELQYLIGARQAVGDMIQQRQRERLTSMKAPFLDSKGSPTKQQTLDAYSHVSADGPKGLSIDRGRRNSVASFGSAASSNPGSQPISRTGSIRAASVHSAHSQIGIQPITPVKTHLTLTDSPLMLLRRRGSSTSGKTTLSAFEEASAQTRIPPESKFKHQIPDRNSASDLPQSDATGSAIKRSSLVESYLKSIEPNDNQGSPQILSRRSTAGKTISTISSLSKMSMALSSLPPLLQYITEMFDIHAKLADIEGANPNHIVDRLLQSKLWDKWCPLREDIEPGTTLLYFAAEKNLISWVKRIVMSSNQLDEPGGRLGYPTIVAANQGNTEVLHRLLAAGAQLDSRDYYGRTVFHHAVLFSDLSVIDTIIYSPRVNFLKQLRSSEYAAFINSRDMYGQTPLHLAAFQAGVSVVEALLHYGADNQSTDNAGRTPVGVASDDDVREAILRWN